MELSTFLGTIILLVVVEGCYILFKRGCRLSDNSCSVEAITDKPCVLPATTQASFDDDVPF